MDKCTATSVVIWQRVLINVASASLLPQQETCSIIIISFAHTPSKASKIGVLPALTLVIESIILYRWVKERIVRFLWLDANAATIVWIIWAITIIAAIAPCARRRIEMILVNTSVLVHKLDLLVTNESEDEWRNLSHDWNQRAEDDDHHVIAGKTIVVDFEPVVGPVFVVASEIKDSSER